MPHRSTTELAIMPCLPRTLSIEDQMLRYWAPSFGPFYILPTPAFAKILRFLNISSADYIAEVARRYAVDLTSSARQHEDAGNAWVWTGERASDWRHFDVRDVPGHETLLGFDALFEIMENASYGGQLAIGGYFDIGDGLPGDGVPVRIEGRFQVGIIDYLWGSGHSVTFDGVLSLDMRGGTIIPARELPYSFDDACGFARDYFTIRSLTETTLPGDRWLVCDRRAEVRQAA